MALTLLGSRVDVAVSGERAPQLADAVTAAWQRCLADPADPPTTSVVEVSVDGDEVSLTHDGVLSPVAGNDRLQVMQVLSTRLTVAAIEARLGELWMLHACALADPATGATVVLVGPSGAGKTTVAATLGQQYGYVTDEAAAIRADGTMLSFPKPLSVRADGLGPKRQVSPDELGLLAAPSNPWLAGVALLDRSGTGRPVVEAVGTVEALPALAEQTSALQLLDRPLHLVAGHLHRTGGLRRITYREAADLAPVVADLISGAA